ncbi:hypothetical protein [Shinella zoogloeoides]|uniref:hypothetical protein n=1 Tax=Shinella zoogloeoides TaxID=352475 RepID=UPI00273D54F2|nr:hypothetical protein [Shinella zoogloeoides]WLR90941.1 hypothetical protein Q9316_00765 [Shinella zoogloeoides]
MTLRKLAFTNSDATPKKIELEVSTASVAPIMAWYGGYHSGDRYSVALDGKRIRKDLNGEVIGSIE